MTADIARALRVPLPSGLEAEALTIRCCAHHAALITHRGYDTWRIAPGESLTITRMPDGWLVHQNVPRSPAAQSEIRNPQSATSGA